MENIKWAERQGNEVFIAPEQFSGADEISLVDLWLVLVRRKRVIIAGILLGVSLAMVFILWVPETYRFSTTITLGQLALKDGGAKQNSPFDAPINVLAKLQGAYIPQVLEKWVKDNAMDNGCPLVAKIPKGSDLITIEAKAPAKNNAACLHLINAAAQMLINDHDKMLAPVRTRLSAQLEGEKLELETIRDDRIFAVKENALKRQLSSARYKRLALEGQQSLLQSRYKHVNIERDLTIKAIQNNEHTLKTALENRAVIIKQSDNSVAAVTLLTLGNEIQNYQERIDNLDQRLSVNLPEKRQNLGNQLDENGRVQQQQAELIAGHETELRKLHVDRIRQESAQLFAIKGLESRIADIRPTSMLREASQSIGPVGSSMAVKLVLGLLLGLMSGVFGVFVTEFVVNAGKIKRSGSTTV